MTNRLIERYGNFLFTDSYGAQSPRSCLLFQKTISGSNTPGYKSMKKGQLPVNPCTTSVITQTPGIAQSSFEDRTDPDNPTLYTSTETGLNVPSLTQGKDERQDLILRLNAKTLASIKDAKVNLAQAAAEASQTASLLAVTARRITKAFVLLRTGHPELAVRVVMGGIGVKPKAFNDYRTTYEKDPIRAAASFWLEIQYGWKPLLTDVFGAVEAISDARADRPIVHTIKKSVSVSKDYLDHSESSGEEYAYATLTRSSVQAFAHSSITYEIDNPALRLASGVGLTDPALLAWELLPYSFVVDWFLPVGKWLENAQATSGLLFKKGSISEKQIVTSSHSSSANSWAWNFTSASEVAGGLREEVFFERTVLTDFPVNPLPQFKNPISFGHCANALALLATAFLPNKGR